MTFQSVIKPVPLTRKAYEPYGHVVAVDESSTYVSANMGTARRYNKLAPIDNLRGERAELNLCEFQVSPINSGPLEMGLLEKHSFSSQVFIPMSADACFLVIVSLGGKSPDLDSLRCFIARGQQGISYHPGVWHYPMTAIDRPVNFLCLVYENGSADDCEIVNFEQPIKIELASQS